MYTYKVVIHPNNKQATKLKQIMNKCIETQNIIYDYLDKHLQDSKKHHEETGVYLPFPKCGEVREWFTLQKGIKDDEVIKSRLTLTKKEQREKHLDFLFYDCSNDALKQTVKDTYNSFIRFLKGISAYPVRRKYSSAKKSFYVDPFKIEFSSSKVKLEKIANNTKKNRTVLNWINLAEKDRIPTNCKYYNPRISYDGYQFYITVGVDDCNAPLKYIEKKKEINKTDEVIGVDVNINTVVTSNSKGTNINIYNSINNEHKVKKVEKRLKRTQKALSRKYIISKKLNNKFIRTNNYIKNKYKLHKLRNKLQNVRDSYLLEVVNNIIFNKDKMIPKKIIIEDLDVKSMQDTKKGKENRYLRPELQKVAFSKLLTKIKEKCIFYNIEIKEANRYFASSKTCSLCHNKKEDLSLDIRVYKCDKCGLVIDRDINAAINLANYKE